MWVMWICAFRCLPPASVESEDVELVELREQIKSNAMDLKTVSKPDTNIRLLTFQQALKARDAKLTGLQNENEQLKSTAVDLEEVLPFFFFVLFLYLMYSSRS
jgi:hypothetical protein